MKDLNERLNLSMLFINHDLSLIAEVCDRVAVMYAGKIVELGPVSDVFSNPVHPYSQALIDVVPTLESAWDKKTVLSGEIPHPSNIPKGCRFHPRCPRSTDRCRNQVPETREVETNRYVYCHYVKPTGE